MAEHKPHSPLCLDLCALADPDWSIWSPTRGQSLLLHVWQLVIGWCSVEMPRPCVLSAPAGYFIFAPNIGANARGTVFFSLGLREDTSLPQYDVTQMKPRHHPRSLVTRAVLRYPY